MIPSSQIDFINQQTPHVLNREVFAKYSQDNRKNRTTLDIEKVNIDIEICNHSPDQKQNYFNELLSRYTEGSNKSLSLEEHVLNEMANFGIHTVLSYYVGKQT
ncbi:hypothetical protein FDP41_007783 [Naegleria fowleri]|uniref:Uncharacterized protein n=1 Tax=Naegleria fowleri TaxID=5763 RepID=A0A6A5CEE7_NAEFO|nr:uncharacterized protein FDP41_007783 [Naegleria fowleri]KAF0983868.1 hypothetical protein FDP41_007783 [Naegleria fowleri]